MRTKFERSVDKALREKGYETYLPLRRVERKWADRLKVGEVPLFPNYVFCRFDLGEKGTVLKTPEVHYVIGHGRQPAPIPEYEITAVQRVVRHGVELEGCASIHAGEHVEVVSGPLAGLDGIVVKIKNRDRLVVSIGLLQRGVATEIGRRHLRPVSSQRRWLTEMSQGDYGSFDVTR